MSTFPILTKLGGRTAAFEKIQLLGFEKGAAAVRMWEQRRRIPGDAVTLLMRVADAAGIEYCASDFEFAETSEDDQ